MDFQKVIKWAEDLMWAKKKRRLNSLERAILERVWKNYKYQEIADEYRYSKGTVKTVAGNLWKMISEELDEKVNKTNFRAAMERFYISNSKNFVQSNFNQGHIKICGESCHSDETPKNRSPTTPTNSDNIQPEKRHDLTSAPKLRNFHNCTNQLATLKQWILTENTCIVTITGLSGIGKTTLTRQLVADIQDNFDRILWRSHRKFSTLNALKTNLIEFFSPPQPKQNLSIIDYLRFHRCLIILDDFQETLTTGEFVSTYIPEYKNYGKLIKEIARSPHNSCLLLLSWEKPTEIANLETENCHCHTLQLQGLGKSATELLKAKKLTDEDRWLELINLYSSNPLWLNIIVSTIQDLFNGSVAQFLSYSYLFLGDLKPILHEHYQRLSESEKLVMQWLANQEIGGNISSQPPEFSTNNDFLGAIQSLIKRGLIKKNVSKEGSVFTLEPVIKEYVKNQSNS
ncbi:MAG: NACHT domain-containing protein [Okeania sp. SIO2C9]|uniref:NB-ARC domain-containing protein n=1 Tax=Okeania sp. SIO2C9 TaxID=2607791 RepID=UPI0013BEDBE8|nr:NB-ARC domain-containing protein [Okeania sp. SIO2C9]NEQ76328.1 NACHT domain-containing protein [Okeania sp. SIO2C9]